MSIESIGYLAFDPQSFVFLKGYLHRFVKNVECFKNEEDLLKSSNSYSTFLLEEFPAHLNKNQFLKKLKNKFPSAKIFFFTDLAEQLRKSPDGKTDANTDSELAEFSRSLLKLFQPKKSQFPSEEFSVYTDKGKKLSPRELDVTKLLLAGLTIKKTSEKLQISFGTANNIVNRIYKKMGVNSRIDLFKKINDVSEIRHIENL